MKVLFHNYHEELNVDNKLFELKDAAIGDGLLRPFQVLKEQAGLRGVTVGTRAVIPVDQADAIIFIDLPDTSRPHVRRMIDSGKALYLIVLESILVRPVSKKSSLMDCFNKIFTYDDSLVDNKRFFKINYSFDLPRKIERDSGTRDNLCVMIAGNKQVAHAQELYSKRIEAIRWFEENHPEDFHLYGTGWDEYNFGSRLPMRVFNRFRPLKKLMAPTFTSYRGVVERKKPVLERYKFAICYENVRDVPGYITEKIFDCFFAGCIPIYLGADNVESYIPSTCFINERNFSGYEELYHYMINCNVNGYLDSIQSYLHGDCAMQFSVETFSNTILSGVGWQ